MAVGRPVGNWVPIRGDMDPNINVVSHKTFYSAEGTHFFGIQQKITPRVP